MNINTSSAYKFDNFEEPQAKRESNIKAITPKKRRSPTGIVKAVFCMAILVSTLSCFIYARVTQTELSAKYNTTVTQLNSIKGENARLQVKIEEELSSDSVEKIAREELNMQALDSSKIEYIQFNGEARAVIGEQQSFFDRAVDFVEGLFE